MSTKTRFEKEAKGNSEMVYSEMAQPRFQGFSSLPPSVVGTETVVAAGHVTTQNVGGRKICGKGGATGFFIVTVTNLLRQMYLSTHPSCGFG